MITIVFYREADGTTPVLAWLDGLPEKARLASIARIELLKEHGHRLQRPHVENLGGGIWELRFKVQGINYRILYFFHRQEAIVMAHGIVKQQAEVPPIEIRRALERKAAFEADPRQHTHKE
jgi:phage-related protein